ncbi:hypothetical protein SNE40_003206 [Patella caerulea]|uniref:Nuclear envelope membrane protein n=1 Tax=Patella caerulea TaxID=87958 RepID=A0AAN8KFQ6_PATCE
MLCSLIYAFFPLVSGSILISSVLSLVCFLSNQQLSIGIKIGDGESESHQQQQDEEVRPIDFTEFRHIIFDVCLIGIFILQHSLMACSFFKNGISKCGLKPVERCIYVAFTGLTLMILIYFWQPVYSLSAWLIDTNESWVLWFFFNLVHCFAWLIIFLEVLIMEPMELIGWKQVYYSFKGYNSPISYKSKGMQKLYRHMRHPGATCFFLILWIHPLMSVDRLILAWFLSMYLKCGFDVKASDYGYYKKHMLGKVSFEEGRIETISD